MDRVCAARRRRPGRVLARARAPAARELASLCTWKPGHAVPRLAIEVVSESHPYKDYVDVQEKYAACGAPELWVLDPHLRGPRHHGGPVALQVWRRQSDGAFARVHAGAEPYRSPALGAWVAVLDAGVRISDDAAGREPWLTREQAARSAEQAARSAEQAARSAEQAARSAEQAARSAEQAARAEASAEREARVAAEARLRELEAKGD